MKKFSHNDFINTAYNVIRDVMQSTVCAAIVENIEQLFSKLQFCFAASSIILVTHNVEEMVMSPIEFKSLRNVIPAKAGIQFMIIQKQKIFRAGYRVVARYDILFL